VYPLCIANDGFFGLSVAKADGGRRSWSTSGRGSRSSAGSSPPAHDWATCCCILAPYSVDNRDENKAEEKEADKFAAYFLMPPRCSRRRGTRPEGCRSWSGCSRSNGCSGSATGPCFIACRTPPLGQSGVGALPGRVQGAVRPHPGHHRGATGLKPAMAEPHSAHEPDRLTPHEFNGERLKRLVREAIEQEEISLGRGAEILGMDLADMRKLAASWVE